MLSGPPINRENEPENVVYPMIAAVPARIATNAEYRSAFGWKAQPDPGHASAQTDPRPAPRRASARNWLRCSRRRARGNENQTTSSARTIAPERKTAWSGCHVMAVSAQLVGSGRFLSDRGGRHQTQYGERRRRRQQIRCDRDERGSLHADRLEQDDLAGDGADHSPQRVAAVEPAQHGSEIRIADRGGLSRAVEVSAPIATEGTSNSVKLISSRIALAKSGTSGSRRHRGASPPASCGSVQTSVIPATAMATSRPA